MQYETKGTELQVRELMRRLMYLDASIYSNTKPAPFVRKPEWFTQNTATIQIQLNPLEDVGNLRRSGASGMRKFAVTIYLQGLQNKANQWGTVSTTVRLVDIYGRYVAWSIDDAAAWLYRATFNTWFNASINVQWGEFIAGRWNSARSAKLEGQFLAVPEAVLLEKANEYRAKAALIVNENSERALGLIAYAENLEAAAAFGVDIATNNF